MDEEQEGDTVKTPEEIEVEAQRRRDIAEAQKFLFGAELNERIIEINCRVAEWKIKHPSLVKDEAPF